MASVPRKATLAGVGIADHLGVVVALERVEEVGVLALGDLPLHHVERREALGERLREGPPLIAGAAHVVVVVVEEELGGVGGGARGCPR